MCRVCLRAMLVNYAHYFTIIIMQLQHGTTPKELSPVAQEKVEAETGEETQQVELVVAEMEESEGQNDDESNGEEKVQEQEQGETWLVDGLARRHGC